MRHECSDCTFVRDKDTLFIFLVPNNLKEQATSKPFFFGKFTMMGWTGHSRFYLFKCKSCGQVSIDSPHGYTDFGLMYLSCDHCRGILPLEVSEGKAIYEREGLPIPKPTKKERMSELNDATADVRARGVKVVVVEDGSKIGYLQFFREYFNF